MEEVYEDTVLLLFFSWTYSVKPTIKILVIHFVHPFPSKPWYLQIKDSNDNSIQLYEFTKGEM